MAASVPLLCPAQEGGEAHTCQTEIKLNGTHTMRGEQETRLVPHLPEFLYLGQYTACSHVNTIFEGGPLLVHTESPPPVRKTFTDSLPKIL